MNTIVTVPNQVLTTPAKPVTIFNKKLESLIVGMKETLLATRKPKGVGLAAPQIGEPYRIFITKPDKNSDIRVFINPELVSQEKIDDQDEKSTKMEGCLSIPAIWGKVRRSAKLTLKFQDVKGRAHEEIFDGFIAIIIQHETDHLNGILFTRRVLEQKGKLYQAQLDKDGKEILEEIKI